VAGGNIRQEYVGMFARISCGRMIWDFISHRDEVNLYRCRCAGIVLRLRSDKASRVGLTYGGGERFAHIAYKAIVVQD